MQTSSSSAFGTDDCILSAENDPENFVVCSFICVRIKSAVFAICIVYSYEHAKAIAIAKAICQICESEGESSLTISLRLKYLRDKFNQSNMITFFLAFHFTLTLSCLFGFHSSFPVIQRCRTGRVVLHILSKYITND